MGRHRLDARLCSPLVGLGALAGLALAALVASGGAASALVVDRVEIGNPLNAADTTGFGSVAVTFWMGRTEITNADYVAFLNAVDPDGTDPLSLWDSKMSTDVHGGILRDPIAPTGAKYSPKPGYDDLPVVWVTWYDAIRLANWLHNGQGTGDTESGAYTILGGTPTPSNGTSIVRNAGAHVWVPSENEWYKAAYYDGGTYATYPTNSSAAPTAEVPPGGTNSANYNNVVLAATDAGAYPGSPSHYGTFDQAGNVWEMNEDKVLTTARRMRGGSWGTPAITLSKSLPSQVNADAAFVDVGFRLAFDAAPPSPPSPVPALSGPSSLLLLALLATAGVAATRFGRRDASRPSDGGALQRARHSHGESGCPW